MKSHLKHLAKKMHHHSGLSYEVCADIVSAIHRKDYVTLSKNIEKYLLTSDQSESLKECGMTVTDVIVGSYDEVLSGLVQGILDVWNDRFGTKIFTGVVQP